MSTKKNLNSESTGRQTTSRLCYSTAMFTTLAVMTSFSFAATRTELVTWIPYQEEYFVSSVDTMSGPEACDSSGNCSKETSAIFTYTKYIAHAPSKSITVYLDDSQRVEIRERTGSSRSEKTTNINSTLHWQRTYEFQLTDTELKYGTADYELFRGLTILIDEKIIRDPAAKQTSYLYSFIPYESFMSLLDYEGIRCVPACGGVGINSYRTIKSWSQQQLHFRAPSVNGEIDLFPWEFFGISGTRIDSGNRPVISYTEKFTKTAIDSDFMYDPPDVDTESFESHYIQRHVVIVPEPQTYLLALLGLAVVWSQRRRLSARRATAMAVRQA